MPKVQKKRAIRMTEKHTLAEQMALRLMSDFGLVSWAFEWNRKKRQFGQCVYPNRPKPGRIELSWHFVQMGEYHDIEDTIRHEIAHALAGPDAGHGPKWVAMCKKVGAKPNRCGEKPMPKGKWRAQCPNCNKEYDRHREPKMKQGWHCTVCGPVKGPIWWALDATARPTRATKKANVNDKACSAVAVVDAVNLVIEQFGFDKVKAAIAFVEEDWVQHEMKANGRKKHG